MAHYDITLKDQQTEAVAADAYQQEGPMTTFFALADDRPFVDAWSQRVASFRTADIVTVRRRNPDDERRLHAVGA